MSFLDTLKNSISRWMTSDSRNAPRRKPSAPVGARRATERLEDRLNLASIAYDATDDTIYVEGSAYDEHLDVSWVAAGRGVSLAQLQVQLTNNRGGNQTFQMFPWSGAPVDKIVFNAYGGDDSNSHNVAIPIHAYGGVGVDDLEGGVGADRLYGGPDGDILDGGGGHDWLYGEAGADWMYGGAGVDFLYGGANNDFLYGQGDADYLFGEGGVDVLFGHDGDDWLFGHDGADYLYGHNGADRLFGGGGDDYLNGGADGDIMKGDAGEDRLYGFGGNDSLYGGTEDDELYGQDGADLLDGDSGDDKLFGGIGDDTLWGGPGADELSGEAGHDTMYGEGGDDWASGADGNDYVYGGPDNDTLYGGPGFDYLFGGSGDDDLDGGDDADTLQGGDGDDRLEGGQGNDHLFGGAGSDALLGWSGLDTGDGGADPDRFYFTDFNNTGDLGSQYNFDPTDVSIFFSAGSPERVKDYDVAGANWKVHHIWRVDEAFQSMVDRTGDNTLLLSADQEMLTFYRQGVTTENGSVSTSLGGWNDNDNGIYLPDNAFNTPGRLKRVVYHEIAHNWDTEGPNFDEFRALSGWTSKIVAAFSDDWVVSDDGKEAYHIGAQFAREYGRWNSREDFATVFAMYFVQLDGDMYPSEPGYGNVPNKLSFIDSMLDSI